MSKRRPLIPTHIRSHLQPGGRYLLAVSGGKDSMALLHASFQVAPLLGLKLEVAHIDHGLRRSSSRDRLMVQRVCRELGLRCHSKRLRPPAAGINVEAWGREQRYAYFAELRRRRKLSWTLTAHTANDVAETLLMRLVTKRRLTSISALDLKRRVLRPMLEVSRDQVESYVSFHSLPWVNDESNADHDFLRNRVRHRLLPYLKRQFPSLSVEALSEQAKNLAEDYESLDRMAEDLVRQLRGLRFGGAAWLRKAQELLGPLQAGMRWRTIEKLMLSKLGYEVGRARARDLWRLFQGRIRRIDLPNGLELVRLNESIQYRKS